MMLLVNTVLTLPHVRYAVARAYVDYIFVIVFSAKIYESYILSISLTYNLRICTCAERSAREILGKPVSDFQVQNYYIYFWRVQEMRVIASYCELAAICLHMLTHICVGVRKYHSLQLKR